VKVEFKKSFTRDLKKIKDKELLNQVKEAIELVEEAQELQVIEGLKKLRGGDYYYRIKVGDYRIGLIVRGNTFTFVRFLHRREIYRYFP
jgi:mRNA interferase RelE/StbE